MDYLEITRLSAILPTGPHTDRLVVESLTLRTLTTGSVPILFMALLS